MQRARSLAPLLALALTVLAAGTLSGCVVVPQNRRAHLADPIMAFDVDALDTHRKQKFYTSREAAAGGDGAVAGGGCSCQ
jgi:hypothetical protein